jgi:hypothetical protein
MPTPRELRSRRTEETEGEETETEETETEETETEETECTTPTTPHAASRSAV